MAAEGTDSMTERDLKTMRLSAELTNALAENNMLRRQISGMEVKHAALLEEKGAFINQQLAEYAYFLECIIADIQYEWTKRRRK